MGIGMLLSERTFEDLDLSRDIESDATASLAPKPPAQFSAMATIGPKIEAEIPFLQRVVRRWYREAADADDLVQDTLLRALASAHLWQPGSKDERSPARAAACLARGRPHRLLRGTSGEPPAAKMESRLRS